MFSMQSVSQNPLIATFQLSSAASLNLGQSQNGVLGNGLNVKNTCLYGHMNWLYKLSLHPLSHSDIVL